MKIIITTLLLLLSSAKLLAQQPTKPDTICFPTSQIKQLLFKLSNAYIRYQQDSILISNYYHLNLVKDSLLSLNKTKLALKDSIIANLELQLETIKLTHSPISNQIPFLLQISLLLATFITGLFIGLFTR